MGSKLLTLAVAVGLALTAYVFGRMQTTEGIDAIVARHEVVLADTLQALQAVRDSLHDENRAIALKVDTLVVRERELVSTADMWAGESARTADQLLEHLHEVGDTIGMSVLTNLVAQHDQETLSLRAALAVSDSIQAFQLAVIGNVRLELSVADERFAASERTRWDIVADLKKRDRHRTLKNVAKVGGTFLAVFGACRLAPESVC